MQGKLFVNYDYYYYYYHYYYYYYYDYYDYYYWLSPVGKGYRTSKMYSLARGSSTQR